VTTPRGITTPERDQAARIRDRLATELAAIHSQRDLSDVGKQRRSARVVVKAQDQLKALQAAEAARVADREDALTRQLFASVGKNSVTGATDATSVISARDAADRASRITSPKDAARLMDLADLHGDAVLLRALARECASRGNPLEPEYRRLFRTWADRQEGAADAIAELDVINDERHALDHRLNREVAFGPGRLPDYLRGGNLHPLAAEADDTEEG